MKKILKKILPNYLIYLLNSLRNGNFFYFFWLFPIKKNKIVVCNYYGKGYGDNAKYIINELIKEKIDDVDIVWLLKKILINEANFPKGIRVVSYGSIKALYELATAKIWIDNSRKVFYPPKRKKQYYIQTWHSPIRLKTIEKDAEESLPNTYIRMAKKDSKNYDLMISGCDFSWNIYRNSFWYSGKILKCGTPRCDIFFQDNPFIKEKVYKYFNLNPNDKLIVFAPTFRNKELIDPYILEFNDIIEAFGKKFGGNWKLLLRLHPNVSHLSSQINFNNKIINATNYDDMQELLYVADALITDYSSCMFDMAIANKICFLHVQDLDDYLSNERKLYFDFNELPFYISKTNEQLINNILNFDTNYYRDNLKIFFESIKLYEKGTASKEIVQVIKAVINNN